MMIADLLVVVCCLHVVAVTSNVEDAQFWNDQTQALLNKYLHTEYNCGVAKNAILFIGDGMGLPSQFAGRILKGQMEGKTGEEEFLEWEKWQHTGLAKTYNTDFQVPDSAGTATAYLSGVKGKKGTIGLDDTLVERGHCPSAEGATVLSICDWAQAEGKSTGLVTTARVMDASPAGLYANAPERNWEIDTEGNTDCKDITRQLIEDDPGRKINVILGGGRSRFTPITQADVEYPDTYGRRPDGRNLIDEWTEQMTANGFNHAYVWNVTQFNDIEPESTDYLLGIFEPGEIPNIVDNTPDEARNPTLAQMVKKAIEILRRNPNGYYLFVESSNIDSAHHGGRAAAAINEVVVLDAAVKVAMDVTDSKDTLMVLTADHSHSMTTAGNSVRGTPIFGTASEVSDVDGMPYTTLLYAAGTGYDPSPRRNLTGVDTADPNFKQDAAIPNSDAPHSGEDVAVFANGPMAHLFRGNFEQTFVAHAMAYAMCVGSNKQHCTEKIGICSTGDSGVDPTGTAVAHRLTNGLVYLAIVNIFIVLNQYI
ncbi:PREDICTED: alkaline phosphatase-like [Priapulus caudatus]|uniref:Alkaline phosphatase n=1 Tax=Priapulus caudatus TaxID=37621 RepID=A0ABM1EB18_PRICU|nr:PREDICTED: alkaline phosphatase-like [Priapulus caudatus]